MEIPDTTFSGRYKNETMGIDMSTTYFLLPKDYRMENNEYAKPTNTKVKIFTDHSEFCMYVRRSPPGIEFGSEKMRAELQKLKESVEADGREVLEGYYAAQTEDIDVVTEVFHATTCRAKCPELLDLMKRMREEKEE